MIARTVMLPSPSSICSLQKEPVNPGDKVLRQRNTTFFGKSADGEDGRLISQNNHSVDVWMPGSFL